jgi:hypothetical protein
VLFDLNGTGQRSYMNDVYGLICGDLFTGSTIGAIDSDTRVGGERVGSMRIEDWFTMKNLATEGNYFGTVQSNPKFYNQCGEVIYIESNAYGYAYAKRYSGVVLSLNSATMDKLEVVLMPVVV